MTNAIPGQEYTLKIIVGDGGDLLYDTAVFLKAKGITSGADLKLTVSAQPASITDVVAGNTARFTFQVENIGPAPAWGVELTNCVPDGPWSSSAPSVWSLPDLPSGASFTTNLVVTFQDDAVEYAGLTVTGVVATATGDYDMSNNEDSATVEFRTTGSGSLSGFVWDDADKDGILSDFETNLVGVAVSLYTNAVSSTPFRTTATVADGTYAFDHLPRGAYIVVFDAPEGYHGFSPKHAIEAPTANSDAEAGEPLFRSQTDVLEIAVDGQMLEWINAGVYQALVPGFGVKIWEDESDLDGLRPDEITLTLTGSDGLSTNLVVTGSGNEWDFDFGTLPKYSDTNLIVYTLSEAPVPHYATAIGDYNEEGWSVTNVFVPFGSVTGTVFHDADANGTHAASESPLANVEVRLRYDGENFASTNTDANGSYTFSGLHLGNDYELWFFLPQGFDGTSHGPDSQVEAGCPVSVAQLAVTLTADAFCSTNGAGFYRAMMPVSGVKVWNDEHDNDGLRPTSITLVLSGGSSDSPTNIELTVSAPAGGGDEWPYDFGLVPVYDDLKMEALWTLAEPDLPSGYECLVAGLAAITNVHEVETVAITARKVWSDDNDAAGERPGSVVMTLLCNGQDMGEASVTQDADWKTSWTVPVMTAGVSNQYDVVERNVPEHYAMSKESLGDGVVEITNTFVPYGRVAGFVWNDADTNGVFAASEPKLEGVSVLLDQNGDPVDSTTTDSTGAYSFDGLRRGSYTVKFFSIEPFESFSHGADSTVEAKECAPMSEATASLGTGSMTNTVNAGLYQAMTTISGTKTWRDGSNQDGIRPSSISLSLTSPDGTAATLSVSAPAGGGDEWPYAFEPLPKYKWLPENGGREIFYELAETPVPGYETTVFVHDVENAYTPATTNVVATKVWDDDNNREGLRPDSVTFSLYTNGVKKVGSDKEATADGGWTVSWEGLAVNSAGSPIAYDVREDQVPQGYDCVVVTNGMEFTVTNRHEIERVTITATKVWDDADDQDGIRPESVVFTFHDPWTATNMTVTAADNWTVSWADRPKWAGPQVGISYRVAEYNPPTGYTADVANVATNWTITNTHIPSNVAVRATKVWDDADNQDGIRPASVTFSLLSNNVAVATAELSADNGWTNVWTGLAERSAGTPIEWTVEESPVPQDYSASASSTDYDWTITNTHIPSNVTVKVTKVWNDAGNQDGIRPVGVTFSLLSNGVSVATSDVSADLSWMTTWTNLPAYAAGVLIAWTVAEDTDLSPEYTATASNRDYDWTITNTHVPSNVTVTATKEWDDADNQDGIRPASVTFSLLSNNVAVATAELSADTGWTNVWTGLSERSAGTPIQWSVEESPVPEGYYDSVASAGNTWRITNTHAPSNVTVTATKSWNDDDDRDRLRPGEVTFTLTSNGVAVASTTVTVAEADGWRATWPDIPQCDSGSPIAYGVREEPVPEGYTPSVVTNGLYDFTVVNTHAPSNVTVTVTKVWSDADNQDGRRPASATLSLYADGVKVRDFTASGSNLTKTWSDLPANAAGTPIVYTVQEDSVPTGYYVLSIVKTATENGFSFVVTNRHPPVKVDISVVKVWDDGNDADKLRPSSVSVSLKANGTVVKTATLSAGGGWATTWTGLPKYANGSAIQYTLVENNIPSGYSCGSIPRVSSSTGYSFTVTNTHSTGTPSLKTTATWTLNRSDGLIYGTFTLKNTGKKAFASNTDFWLATPGSGKTWYIYNPTGQMPDGAAYYDFSAAVRAAAKKVGNKNAVLDPGESVSVTGVKIYHKSRISPAEYLDVKTATHAGRLFHASDSNRNFVISSSELKAAQKAWSAGTLSDDDLLEATRLAAGAAYLWNDAARNWKTLSKDKR